MRLPKSIAATGLAGLLAGAIVGVPAASAAQNFAPQCETSASIANYDEYKVAYEVICTDFTSTENVETAGNVNAGVWTAKAYNEGDYVKYTDGKWYKAALDVTAADEPTKPVKDAEDNDVVVWIEQTSDVAAAWSASSTAATTTAGSFPAGYVVSYGSSPKTWYRANAATVAADVPGVSAKWDVLTAETTAGKYTGPLPGGSKKVSVTYPGSVSGYSLVALNREVLGFETEPAVLNSAGDAPAPLQTQYCNGEKPGFGIACSLQSSVNVYAKKTDDSFVKVTGATLAVKSGASYTDLKDTTLYGDKTVTGSPDVTSASTDFLNIGALGLPTNPGKKIFPAQSGSRIVGELELTEDPCAWGDLNTLRMVVSVTDGEGQIAPPQEVTLPRSKYYRIAKNSTGAFERFYIAAGCKFNYRWNDIQVYSRVAGKDVKLAKPARNAPAITVEATT